MLSRGLMARMPGGAAGRRLAAMAMVDGSGTGMFLAASALFFVRKVGLSTAQLGIGLSLAGVVSLCTAIPIGHIADRAGPRRALVGLTLWRAVGFSCYSFVHSFAGFLVVACLLGVPNSAASPVLQMLIGKAVDETERVRTLAAVRAARNIGFTIGAAAAGVAVAVDTRPAYLAVIDGDAASFLVVAVVVATLPLLAKPSPVPLRRHPLSVLEDRRYLSVAALNMVLTSHMTLLAVAIPLWVGQHTSAPRSLVSVLIVVNTAMAVFLQIRASRGCETVAGAARAQARAGSALLACCILFAAAGRVGALAACLLMVAGTVALTGGELWQSAGGWGLSYHLADPQRQGAYLALFGLGTAGQEILAPLLVTALVVPAGTLGWLCLGMGFALCGAASVPVARLAQRRSLVEASA